MASNGRDCPLISSGLNRAMSQFDAASENSHARIGTVLCIVAAIGFLVVAMGAMGGLPQRWDLTIRQNFPILFVGCLGLQLLGLRELLLARRDLPDWSPQRPGVRFNSLVVYTRPDCPLCEEAVELLERYREWLPPATEVNIEDDPILLARFGESIPVVEFDHRIRFRGILSEVLLRRLIEGTRPQPRLRRR